MNFETSNVRDWHTLDLPALREKIDAREKGLPPEEVVFRREKYGSNSLPKKPPPTILETLVRQFQSPLIYILGLAAFVSALIGEFTDAGFIAAVLILNAIIGGYQEWRAEQSAQALQKLLQIRATVERDGDVYEIDAEELVPGDLVWLESGNLVPADLRLIMAHGFEIDESFLTGESLPVLKDPAWLGVPETPVGDRVNMAYAGSTIVRGRARGWVVATGESTAVGQLAKDVLTAGEGKPPLIVRMERFSKVVAMAVLFAAFVVALVGIFIQGNNISEMFLFGVALAVSAIPEGLPVALTVALAIGTTRMARRGVIVRRLAAVEGLGSCTLVASDKTGTLTCNELTVREICLPNGETMDITGEGFTPEGELQIQGKPFEGPMSESIKNLGLASVLCNEADLHHRDGTWVWRGDPTDIALLSMGYKMGFQREETLSKHPQVNQIPFEPEYQFAASYHSFNTSTGVRIFVKGAPERVLSMCGETIDAPTRDIYHSTAEAMAKQGYRVLALAEGTAPADLDPSKPPPQPTGLVFLGFVGMIDPLRPGVREAVTECHSAGVTVSMITGDHPQTALAIARDLGLASSSEQVVTGSQLENLSDEELTSLTNNARVFARVAPHQKLSLVNAMRSQGHFVAVTGDGVNDAPALRVANIGVAMGRSGTDVAREAAELVISDDNFATIVAGIEEGRVAYDNIRKVIYLLVSTGAAEVIMVLLAVSTGMPLPLLPVQLLWLNLVTNGIQDVALAFDPSEGGILERKPRPPKEPIFNRLMIERTVVAAIAMGVVGFVFFWWAIQAGWSEYSARNATLLLWVLFENIHIANCRSETKSAFRTSIFSSPILLIGVVVAFSIHLACLYLPVGQMILKTEPVSLENWKLLLPVAFSILVVMEFHKLTWALRKYNDRTPDPVRRGQG